VLFNRVRKAAGEVEGREWLLLGLETLGVVAGILIAFELNEWADRRKDAARNRQVVERLLEESEEIVSQLRSERDGIKKLTDTEMKFATLLVRDRECPPAELWFSAFSVNMYPAIAVQTSVYEEMMGAGGLSTLESGPARQAVGEFHTQLGWVNRQIEFFRTHAKPTVDFDDPRVSPTFDPEADEPLGATFDRAALCSDRGFRSRVADEVRDHQLVYSTRADLTRYAIRMCSALGHELGKKCSPTRGGPLSGKDLAGTSAP